MGKRAAEVELFVGNMSSIQREDTAHSQSERQLSDWFRYGKVTPSTRALGPTGSNEADEAFATQGASRSP